jgi:preprotein translocase SecF subunit
MPMLRTFRLVPDDTRISFMRYQYVGYALSAALILLTVILLPLKGLSFGIDFQGGILIEVGMPGEAADLAAMRATLGEIGLGEVALQEFGAPTDILIRVQRQKGGEEAQLAAVDKVRAALTEEFGEGISYRRVEFVGPKVSSELLWASTQAVIYSILAILVYIWFRFEWQYGIGGILALIHDTVATLGLFVLFGLEFNLSSVAALLTIVGYSLNDNVVIYDRVRENLRKYKTMPLPELLDLSINQTLARTVTTSLTTLLALLALVIFGGPVIRDFTIAMIWGVVIGTFSTIYVATPVLVHFNLRRTVEQVPAAQTP